MPRPQSESSRPTLRKSQRLCWRFQNCLAHRLLAGGVPGPGVVVERSYIPSQPYEIAKNGEKTGGFEPVFAYKSPKTPFFAIKYLTRYTHETFFKENINLKIFRNLSHCGVIPVRSFGSQIRPQPHGSGLIIFNTCFTYFSYMFILRIFNKCNFFNFLAYLRIFDPYQHILMHLHVF